jgi:ribosome assembly protein YihI (activator of Der GTPase)
MNKKSVDILIEELAEEQEKISEKISRQQYVPEREFLEIDKQINEIQERLDSNRYLEIESEIKSIVSKRKTLNRFEILDLEE